MIICEEKIDFDSGEKVVPQKSILPGNIFCKCVSEEWRWSYKNDMQAASNTLSAPVLSQVLQPLDVIIRLYSQLSVSLVQNFYFMLTSRILIFIELF